MTDTQITFARARLGGRAEDVVLAETRSGGLVVHVGGALAIDIPTTLDPAVLDALSDAFAHAAQQQTSRHGIKAVAA
ncbi:hypothetical protein ABZ819_04880 [Streptomyces venezuelae]|uniref:hypothetical protein n=1 Tax=Streptomyces venezuelae TaxID=54571 RepID=UPI00341556BC